jgi:putative selenium metabolism hydrolase
VDERRDALADLLCELIRRPSPSAQEGPTASYAVERIRQLGMRARTDRVGNAVVELASEGATGGLLLTAHMDHVPPGDMPDPYVGKRLDGEAFGVAGEVVYGRGACGQKASLAAMLVAVEAVIRAGVSLQKPVLVAGTVLEEPGGEIGVRELVEGDGLRPDWAIVGECSSLDVYLGHRGIVNVRITTLGTSVHASTPELGVSALESMARVILAADTWRSELPADPVLGPSVLTINSLTVVPNATNVLPERCVAVADGRNVPALSPDEVVAFVDRRLAAMAAADPRFRYEVSLARRQVTTWPGAVAESSGCIQGSLIAPDHPLVEAVRSAARLGRGSEPALGYWSPATDAGYLSSPAGVPCVGFGPGDPLVATTAIDHVRVDDLLAAARSYAAAIVALCGEPLPSPRGNGSG